MTYTSELYLAAFYYISPKKNNMRPEDVNPANFTVEKIIYNKNNFSIAIGTWNEDETRRFAMRWNEKDGNSDDKGYPSVFQHPMWFQFPDGNNNINEIIQILTENNV